MKQLQNVSNSTFDYLIQESPGSIYPTPSHGYSGMWTLILLQFTDKSFIPYSVPNLAVMYIITILYILNSVIIFLQINRSFIKQYKYVEEKRPEQTTNAEENLCGELIIHIGRLRKNHNDTSPKHGIVLVFAWRITNAGTSFLPWNSITCVTCCFSSSQSVETNCVDS